MKNYHQKLSHFSAFRNDTMITLQVAGDVEAFQIPKSTLCAASKYFIGALDGSFSEAIERRITLPGCDLDTARVFIYWLKEHKLPDFAQVVHDQLTWDFGGEGQGVKSEYESGTDAVEQTCIQLVHVWMLGDQLLMPVLQNAAMEEILDVLRIHNDVGAVGMELESLKQAYCSAPAHSCLSKLFVAQAIFQRYYCDCLDDADIEGLMTLPGFCKEFLAAIEGTMDSAKGRKICPTDQGLDPFMVPT